jgi:hypothetical protein
MDMTPYRMIALVLVVALLLTAVTPARAEAMEVGTILLIVGAGIVVVILVAYLVVASMSERRRAEVPAEGAPVVVVMLPQAGPVAESP